MPGPLRGLHARHRHLVGLVATSATLEPLDYWADVLGLAPLSARSGRLPQPVPGREPLRPGVPPSRTAFRERARHYEAIARLLQRVVRVRPGNYAAYFPSFAFLAPSAATSA